MIPLDQDEENELYILALEAAGIDNWEWYSEAMNDFNNAKKDALLRKNSIKLVDMLTEFIVDNTELQEGGLTVTFSTNDAKNFITELLAKKQKLQKEIEKEIE